jgi:DNA-binding LytR/AlgR family response regulator
MKKLVVRFQRDRALEHIEVLVRAPRRDAAVTELLERLSGRPPDLLQLSTVDGKNLRLDTEDIIAVSVRDKLTLLLTEDGAYTLRQSLQSIENALDPERFLRISRHELVNTDKVLKYEFTVGGTLRLELADGTETWASRRCIPAVRRRLNGCGRGV